MPDLFTPLASPPRLDTEAVVATFRERQLIVDPTVYLTTDVNDRVNGSLCACAWGAAWQMFYPTARDAYEDNARGIAHPWECQEYFGDDYFQGVITGFGDTRRGLPWLSATTFWINLSTVTDPERHRQGIEDGYKIRVGADFDAALALFGQHTIVAQGSL